MFLGTYTPKLDDKGRLTLPAKFREDLADGLMVTKGQDHSLAVYPRDEFAARARKAAAASRTNPRRARLSAIWLPVRMSKRSMGPDVSPCRRHTVSTQAFPRNA